MSGAPERSARLRRVVEGVIGVPATEGNTIVPLRNGIEIFPAMLGAIDSAQHTIDFLTFVYWRGEIGTAFANHLAARARDGVRVRVLLDAYGARTIDPELVHLLERSGVDLRWFRPLRGLRLGEVNHRTHRKVLVVDEKIGFTGGVGIADEWCGDARGPSEWRDTHFRIEGPVVDGLRAAFLDNWAETSPVLFDDADRFPPQPSSGSTIAQCVRGAAETGWSDIATLFRCLLCLAEERVRITTAYFVPDGEMVRSICDAARRGVAIELLLPGPFADKRFVQLASGATYDDFLDAGVRIWNFQPSMLHAKVMTIDGLIANIGSANINARSTKLDEEVNVVAFDADLVRTLDEHFDADLQRSVPVKAGQWRERPLAQRAVEQLTAPLRRVF